MSNYIKTTDFAIKDTYAHGDPRKTAQGADVDTEFNNIATAIATKQDSSSKGVANGYAPLDGSARLPAANLPTTVPQLSTVNVFSLATAAGTDSYPITLEAAAGGFIGIKDTSGAVDTKRWDFGGSASTFQLRTLNDAGTTAKLAVSIARTANAISSMTFGYSTDNPSYTFSGTGTVTSHAFSGIGTSLTALNASNISSGSIGSSFVPSGAVTQYASSMKCRNLPSKGGTNVNLQNGGSPTGGSDGDIFYIY